MNAGWRLGAALFLWQDRVNRGHAETGRLIGFSGFAIRVSLAVALVLATFNATGFSNFHWVRDGFATDLPLKALAGVVLVIGYVIYVRATMRSIGVFGVGLIAALFAALAWVLFDYGVLDVQTPGILQWLVPIAAGLIMGIGLSWSHVRRSITGQGDVDDVDE